MSVMVQVGEGIVIKKCSPQERDQRLRDLCRTAGVKLIRLRSTADAPTEHFGAQPVVISSVRQARGGVKIVADFKMQPNGLPNTRGLLEFTPNDFGVFEAEMPVSEKNMRLLAVAYLKWTPQTASWEIVEQKDADEVARFANDEENQKKYGWEGIEKTKVIESRPYREYEMPAERTSVEPVVIGSSKRAHLKKTADKMSEGLV